jgi:acyl carrier protein
MTNKEKLSLLEEMLDVEEGSLNEEMNLSDVSEWDSMAALSFIALLDEKFDKQISANQIKEFKTVSDVLKVME